MTRKTTIVLIAIITGIIFWLLFYSANPRSPGYVEPEMLAILDALCSVMVAATVSMVWKCEETTARSAHLLSLYWSSLAGAVAATAGSLAIAITTPTSALTFHTLPAWRPAGSFGLLGIALVLFAMCRRVESAYCELRYPQAGSIFSRPALTLSEYLRWGNVDSCVCQRADCLSSPSERARYLADCGRISPGIKGNVVPPCRYEE